MVHPVSAHPILVNGQWVPSQTASNFSAIDPNTSLPVEAAAYPVSSWSDCHAILNYASAAFDQLAAMAVHPRADFLESYAERIDNHGQDICEMAFRETGLPVRPRLIEVELPRTVNQLRLAAAAARDASWSRPTIDTVAGIRSIHRAIGPVAVFGPNNFPLAFGSISGGDFAAVIAAGNPVIAKANSSHPGTTRLLAELALQAADDCHMPHGTVQLIYRLNHADGDRMVADPRLAAVGYTGGRWAGLHLKQIADKAGKPIFLELSSINPVILLPGAIRERAAAIVVELVGSCLLGNGQFCTSPGLILLLETPESDCFIRDLVNQIDTSPIGVLLSKHVADSLQAGVTRLIDAGGNLWCGGVGVPGDKVQFANTVLQMSGQQFLSDPTTFQTELFGNAILVVLARDSEQLCQILLQLEGNLTGTIYSHSGFEDDHLYQQIETKLRHRVGRLLNDKMPTGVAVSAAMNHGGPYPATGHPGFTAVGIPPSIIRFSALQCYDQVRDRRLPAELQDRNPNGIVRCIDGHYTSQSIIGSQTD